MNPTNGAPAQARARPSAYVLTAATWGLAVLGAVFYWWAPLGMVLSLCGLLAALIGCVRLPRPVALRVLLVCGLVAAAAALAFDLTAVRLGLDTVRFGPLR